jgi:hypothetical protein
VFPARAAGVSAGDEAGLHPSTTFGPVARSLTLRLSMVDRTPRIARLCHL